MATQLRIPPEQMRQRAASFTEHAVNLNQIIDSMDKLLKALQEEWEGDASTAFADQYNELRPKFVQTKDLIEQIGKTLSGVAKSAEQFDTDMKNQINQ